MTDLTSTTLPVGLVRDLEAAYGRPGAGVIRIHLATDGTAAVVDRRRLGPPVGDEVSPPCPQCSTPMSVPRASRGELVCPDPECGVRRSIRQYRRLLRLSTHLGIGVTPELCPVS